MAAVGEPAAVLEDPQHRLLPLVCGGGVVWSRSESGLVVGCCVEESVSGDVVGGVVPDSGAGGVGGSCSDPGGEPVGCAAAELVGGAVDGDVGGAAVEVCVAWFDSEGGQFDPPIQLGLSDVTGHRVQGCRGGGGVVEGVGVADDGEFAPRHGLGDVGPTLVLEVDEAYAGEVVDGDDVSDVVAVEGTDAAAFVDPGAGLERPVVGVAECGGVGDVDCTLGIASGGGSAWCLLTRAP